MNASIRVLISALLVTTTLLTEPARAQATLPISDAPYPGTLTLQVDATDIDRRIFRVKETVPVRPGPLTLLYPRWLPGNHGPTGVIAQLAGLKISAAGAPVAWKRDPLDAHAFALVVPAGVSALEIEFQSLSPVSNDNGRVVMTPEMLNVQWNAVLLYPAGHDDSRIAVKPALRVPAGWKFGTALEVASTPSGALIDFKPVSVETLIDSPVFAGKHFQRLDLDPDGAAAGRTPVFLNVMADVPSELVITPEQLAAHRALVTQADRLFGTRHFAHYDFLFSISDNLGWIGLEHHQSSENGVPPGYFAEWAKTSAGRDLLPHEYTHSWNGKFRRPADLLTPNTNTPMQDSLLWMYEGQTQYWGNVLAARAGLMPLAEAIDNIADVAATLDSRAGRTWRNLQDTTNEAVMRPRDERHVWQDWQRQQDYYDEMVLVWLEADMLIREASGGARSLDDFARAFFGVEPGRVKPLAYTFADAVAALNQIEPHDWARFLRERLDTNQPGAPLKGLARAGWRLAWSEEPSAYTKGLGEQRKFDDFSYSLGFNVGKRDMLDNVRWGGPAFNAGLTTAAQLIAVDGRAYKADRLKSAITAAKTSKAPIALLVKDGEVYKTVAISWSGGLRYPKLERIDGTEDRLTKVLTARP
jgi:predicted metalloprotease with PDZ domain